MVISYFDKDILSKYTVWVAAWDTSEPLIPHHLWQYGFEKNYDGTNGQVDADTSNTDFAPVMKEHHLNGY
jgi:GH25 family lysozyme M1 (1,4-beta-N-acetylmuramidase)